MNEYIDTDRDRQVDNYILTNNSMNKEIVTDRHKHRLTEV